MEIAKIGEFGLIDRLTEGIKPQNVSTLKGVGDDCAVMHYPDTEVLVTTDMLMEGVHFDLTYIATHDVNIPFLARHAQSAVEQLHVL